MRTRPGNAFAGILLATFLGIVAMHGLGSHGVHGAESRDHAMAAHAAGDMAGDMADAMGAAPAMMADTVLMRSMLEA